MMGLFNKKKTGGIMDEIRCDESSYLIWKWHPKDAEIGNNNRENAIRLGSSLRVKDGEVAVFVYNQNGKKMQDFIEGPFDQILKTKNLPILASIVGLAYDGGTPFQAEIYFINLAQIIQTKFAVPFFDVYDPRFSDFGVPIAVRGTLSFRIANYKEFIKLHRLQEFDLDAFQQQVRDAISRYTKDIVANAPASNNIPVLQIETKISQINDSIEYDVKERMKEDFGIEVAGVDISAIEIDKESSGYQELMSVTKNMTTARVHAETTDYVERLRIQREEGQYAMHKGTQTANIGAFQVEKQTEVGIAGAEALGHMGENGAGNVSLGGNETGFNPAAMMAGMAVGGAVGQNIAGTMNSMMNPTNVNNNLTPPPVPNDAFHMIKNEQDVGPFSMNDLLKMIITGELTKETLVWKAGDKDWVKAEMLDELKGLFK